MTTITVNGYMYDVDSDADLKKFINNLIDCGGSVKSMDGWDDPVFWTYHHTKGGYQGSIGNVTYGLDIRVSDIGGSISKLVNGTPDTITIDNATLTKTILKDAR